MKLKEERRRYVAFATKIKDIAAACRKTVARHLSSISLYLLLSTSIFSWAITSPQDDKSKDRKPQPKAQPKAMAEDDGIPDSLLHARWKIQRTAPIEVADLDSFVMDLNLPDNIRQTVEYDDSLNMYVIGSKIGDTYLNAPVLMTPEEYQRWSARRAMRDFFRRKEAVNVANEGKDQFDLMDMHFDLGPAEKIFGPGGVRIKTQGTAELKMGATLKNIDNPSLPIRNRKTTSFDFDEKINLNVNGKVGDKVNMNLNYNTDATFDFDTQNLKLKYDGKEDEIIKLVEGGNVSFPSNNSLVKGASSLFGLRTDMQFGKLKLQTVISQKKSSTKSVASKGGTQTTAFELDAADYEENRHFFLSRYFRDHYDASMSTLPNLTTGIEINRVEIWVTNKSGTTSNTRNIIALTDLGENTKVSNRMWTLSGSTVPSNAANSEYATLVSTYAAARDIDQTSTVLNAIPGFEGGVDYEKLSSARLLTSSEYTLNKSLGYISLKTGLQTDQVLAVAYEFTAGGQTYQVGEFASDNTQTGEALFVKSLKNTSNNPAQGNWDLMMKNVYYLASTVEKTKFRLDIKYQSDTAGVYLTYIPDARVKDRTLLKMLGCDRLDNNNKVHANGYFDFIEGYTVSNGRVFLPSAEPFGDYLRKQLTSSGLSQAEADKYVFDQLYDSTKTVAKQNAEKDKFMMMGQYKGHSANVISLGAYNVPQGSVVVTAGGVTLQEGTDYSVDYSAGEVTILNQSIIDAGTNVNVSLESNTEYGMQRKTMLGMNWEYDFSKNLQVGGTLMHLSEQALTSKVTMGSEPLRNTIWGLNVNWKQESQWLTSLLNKIPFLHVTEPSQISFKGEFAQLIAGTAGGTQDNASYIDDFENTKNYVNVNQPSTWTLSSVPTMFAESTDKTGVSSGYNRALLSWYNVDPIFTRRSSTLTPSHIKSDLEQLSNHYVREVYVKELYPNRDQSTYNGATSTLPILNLAYYPQERGPYNLTRDLNSDGTLRQPETKWGGMMRRLETTDFEQANIEYIEFWLLDPFIYTRQQGNASDYAGDLYINLGEVSEDVLRDGKKFYESGMPVDGSESYTTTQWGKIPQQATQTYAFATTKGSRVQQDVGFNGLNDDEEREYGAYKEWLDAVVNSGVITNDSIIQAWRNDPAGDDYHYFRGSDFDEERKSILDRYKRINNPQGNSPDTDDRTESYDTSYKTGPDVEDINQDFTLNEYERYYQYKVRISPEILDAYRNGAPPADCYITDMRTSGVKLRNGDTTSVIFGDSMYYGMMSEDDAMSEPYYDEVIRHILVDLGYSDEEATGVLKRCFAFEQDIAKYIMTTEEQSARDAVVKENNPRTMEQLEAEAGDFPIRQMLAAYGADGSDTYILTEPEWLAAMDVLYDEDYVQNLRDYLICYTAQDYATLLDRSTYDVYYEVINGISGAQGTKSDEKSAADAVNTFLPMQMGRLYADRYVTDETKKEVSDLTDEIIDAYRDMLKEESFLSEETRRSAVTKLDNLQKRIAKPDKWEDDSGLTFKGSEEGGNLLSAQDHVGAYWVERMRSRVNQKVDRDIWTSRIQQVNAFYDPSQNTITLCGGILGGSLYDASMSREELFASVGDTVAHEISHAFDTTGAQFDEKGNLRNWWTEEDQKAFAQRADKLVAYFDNIEPFQDVNCVGSQIEGEAIADLVAMKILLRLAAREPGFDYDKFFRSFSETWKTITTIQTEYYTLSQDTHPLAYLRVNAMVQQFDEFYDTYGIRKGDGMYLAPDQRLEVW